ncbi:MAG: 2-dehydropantoate 2-reductase [Desulfotignum sp.]
MSKQKKIHSICIYGTGGIGGFFGAKIAHTCNHDHTLDYDCFFVARGDHLRAIRQNGITLISDQKAITGVPAAATDDMNDLPDPDLIVVCVKSYDLDDAVKAMAPKIHAHTIILPLLNGADIYERIRKNIHTGVILPACVYVGTHIQSPGVIYQSGGDGRILFGADPKYDRFDPKPVTDFFDAMQINYQWRTDPYPDIWSKYLFIAAFALVTVFYNKTIGEVAADPEAAQTAREIMGEIYAIATARGVQLPEHVISQQLAVAGRFPYETKTSFQRDVASKGRVNEGDLYGGTILRQGLELGVPTPVTRSVYAAIQESLSADQSHNGAGHAGGDGAGDNGFEP